jgi:enediyne polyketide synthase
LVLMGRSDPQADRELTANLERITGAGVRCHYVRADVTDTATVSKAIANAEKKFGRITGFLHGAGMNTPQLIAGLDSNGFGKTLAPKVQGARNVLAALQTDRLRLFVGFSSIIARTGLPGEADYATANEWLTALTEEFQKDHPNCRCLALEWSVWSGVGMGDRLGRLESLAQQGITPISPDEGVRKLLQLLHQPPESVGIVIAGRFGEPPALRMHEKELPLQRFLEHKRVYYPGIELVVDAALSLEADPYLKDHALQGGPVFPAVFGFEAMAQVAMSLIGRKTAPAFEGVKLARPITIGRGRPTNIRIAALKRAADIVEVVIRSEETDFHVDHFRALCRFGSLPHAIRDTQHATRNTSPSLHLDPCKDLYGSILFHEGRFQRLGGYRLLSAKECVAEITADGQTSWFGPYHPSSFVLGDPGARDASLHGIQACIPHQRILPAGVERIVILDTKPGLRFVHARERFRQGNTFIYDFVVTNSRGKVVEQWTGLELRAIENLSRREAWPRALVGPYLERRLEELVASPCVSVALDHAWERRRLGGVFQPKNVKDSAAAGQRSQSDTTLFLSAAGERAAASDAAIQRALGKPARVWRRPDGRPVTCGPGGISTAHQQTLTLAIAGKGQVACDLETVTERSDSAWLGLLGKERLELAARIARVRPEALGAAATRLWTAFECLRKAGLPPEAPLVLEATTEDGWVVLRSGMLLIASCVVAIAALKEPLAFAIALRPEDDSAKRRPFPDIISTANTLGSNSVAPPTSQWD